MDGHHLNARRRSGGDQGEISADNLTAKNPAGSAFQREAVEGIAETPANC
jgi:hypothetical protein